MGPPAATEEEKENANAKMSESELALVCSRESLLVTNAKQECCCPAAADSAGIETAAVRTSAAAEKSRRD